MARTGNHVLSGQGRTKFCWLHKSSTPLLRAIQEPKNEGHSFNTMAQPVCKFYLEGRCKFGPDCKNLHPEKIPSDLGQVLKEFSVSIEQSLALKKANEPLWYKTLLGLRADYKDGEVEIKVCGPSRVLAVHRILLGSEEDLEAKLVQGIEALDMDPELKDKVLDRIRLGSSALIKSVQKNPAVLLVSKDKEELEQVLDKAAEHLQTCGFHVELDGHAILKARDPRLENRVKACPFLKSYRGWVLGALKHGNPVAGYTWEGKRRLGEDPVLAALRGLQRDMNLVLEHEDLVPLGPTKDKTGTVYLVDLDLYPRASLLGLAI